MNLYCYELKQGITILDVGHLLAKDNKEVYKRLDATIKQCEEHGLEYNNYAFHRVGIIDGVDISKFDFNLDKED